MPINIPSTIAGIDPKIKPAIMRCKELNRWTKISPDLISSTSTTATVVGVGKKRWSRMLVLTRVSHNTRKITGERIEINRYLGSLFLAGTVLLFVDTGTT